MRWCDARCSRERSTEIEEREARREAREARERRRRRAAASPSSAIDGLARATSAATLDWEDDTLLLRIHQRMQRAAARAARKSLSYEHVFVDEAQDLSPLELAVVLDTVALGESVTLAGDVAQRLMLDNGFSDWKSVLGELGLRTSRSSRCACRYRSTQEIMDFANAVLGPLAQHDDAGAPRATACRSSCFASRTRATRSASWPRRCARWSASEPPASVAVIARYPEQADATTPRA